MENRTPENCRLIKAHGEPGKDGNGKCLGFAKSNFDDEPCGACKRCSCCTSVTENFEGGMNVDRLTIPDEPIEGGMRRARIDVSAVRKSAMTIYWALKKYEDTGLTPEEIMDGRMLTGWIPVNERLPECEKEVLIQTTRETITTAIYEDGNMPNENSIWYWTDVDFDYVEETDTEYVPEGWWEYRHFNPDDVYNNTIDEDVVAWMPLPKLYKTKRGLKGKGERGMKRLTVGELRTALEGLPDELVIEITDGACASPERILEYVKRLHAEDNEECDT